MSNFNTTKLTGDRVLITGGKGRRYVADATQFNELNATMAERRAVDRFDQAVSSFFAPLTQAAQAAERETRVAVDPYAYVVLEEGEDAVEGKESVVVELAVDTQILRMLHLEDTSRLLWVGKDRIEIAAYDPDAEAERDAAVMENSFEEFLQDLVASVSEDPEDDEDNIEDEIE